MTSGRKAAQRFADTAADLDTFVASIDASGLSKLERSWAYEAALIKLTVAFERLMLEALVAATNNDTGQMSVTLGIRFPKHLTKEVCEYIVTGGRYFDFRGRDGLLRDIKRLVGPKHYLYTSVQQPKYKVALEQLIALRNFAAHESPSSRQSALKALGRNNLASAGSYLKVKGRFIALSKQIQSLASDLQTAAPY